MRNKQQQRKGHSNGNKGVRTMKEEQLPNHAVCPFPFCLLQCTDFFSTHTGCSSTLV